MGVSLTNKATGTIYTSSSGTRATVSPAVEQEQAPKTSYSSPSGSVKLTVTVKNANYVSPGRKQGSTAPLTGTKQTGTQTADYLTAMNRLKEQRLQAAKSEDSYAVERINEQMKALRASAGKQTLGDRVRDTLSGAGYDSFGSLWGAAGLLVNTFQDPDRNRSQIQRLRESLETGRTTDGKAITPAMHQTIEESIARMEGEIQDWESDDSAANRIYKAADDMTATGEQLIQSAKTGLGKAGQFAVDLGAAGGQLAGDALTGGLIGTGIRTFGSGAQQARQSGADVGQQMAYGLGSAAVGVLTEKIANVAGPFKKAFGSGVLDKALAKIAAKPMGKIAVSALSEALEEGAEGAAQPLLQKLTYNPEAAYDADWLADTLYSMVIGGVLGGAGGGIDVAVNRNTVQNPTGNGAGAHMQSGEGKVTPWQNAGAQGVSGQNNTASQMGAGNTRLTQFDLEGYMQIGDRKHVRNRKDAIVERGESPILTKVTEIVDFIRRSLTGEVRDTIKAYGRVGTQFADRVRNATNGEVLIDGYYLELDSNKISHMSDHVDKDKDPRSIPLTAEQLEQLPEYIDTFDDLISVIRRKDGSVRLMLGKKINGHSIIIESVSKGRESLHPVTAYQVDSAHYEQNYKTKAVDRSSTSQPADAGDVDISRPATTFDDMVAESGSVVNGGNRRGGGTGITQNYDITPKLDPIDKTKSPATASDGSADEPQSTVAGTELSDLSVTQNQGGSNENFADTDITPKLDDGQFSMGRSFSELVQNQRDGVQLRRDGQFAMNGFDSEDILDITPKLTDIQEPEIAAKTQPGDSDTDGYLEALARDENELIDPVTPADIVYDAKLSSLQQEEAPSETQRQTISKRDVDELVQLYQDVASPVEPARDARFKESEGLISASSEKEKQSIREKASSAKSYFMRKMVDAGDSVTKMGKTMKDNYLYPFYNMARSSASAGVNMIQNEQTDITGKKVGQSLNNIFAPIREQGDAYYEQFQTYMLDLHNIDRMSLVTGENTAKIDAEMALRKFDRENPDVATLTEARLQRKAQSIDEEEAALAQERIRLLRKLNQADKMGNKPVFGWELTADMSRERSDRLLREHPEFAQYRDQVRQYIRNLMQYRVDSGLMTAEDAAFLEKYYPNYVPTFRATEKDPSKKDKKSWLA